MHALLGYAMLDYSCKYMYDASVVFYDELALLLYDCKYKPIEKDCII